MPFSEKLKKRVLPPKKCKNKERRDREYLTPDEIAQLKSAVKNVGRHQLRDETIILIMYRHGLRVTELTNLKWSQIDLKQGLIRVHRLKKGRDTTQPLRSQEIRSLKRIKKDYIDSPYIFISERGSPLTDRAIRYIIARGGILAGIPFPIHPHMLRHSTGYYLANAGHDTRAIQDYLGHKNINHTVRYTELSPIRFNNFWKD